METVELLSVASIGGVYRIGSGVAFPGRGLQFTGPAFSLCPTQVMKSEHSLPKTLEGRGPLSPTGEKTSEAGASVCANPCKAFTFQGLMPLETKNN